MYALIFLDGQDVCDITPVCCREMGFIPKLCALLRLGRPHGSEQLGMDAWVEVSPQKASILTAALDSVAILVCH